MARRSLSDPGEIAYYLAYAPVGIELTDRDPVIHALNWSAWRRHRQAIARHCHYRQRSSGHEPLLEY
ncbi:hypothetical protein ACFTXB_28520 [Streptomyces sp. NPDC057074]|uniref:hypothetical protein n=1 Tax=Streptomyces sp. NPDC057074 TaxID=3346015 RepID=UPI0036313E36